MISPDLWASVPYRNLTAMIDFAGQFHLWHIALAQKIGQTTGKSYRLYPVGDGRGDAAWLSAIQKNHNNAAAALGIAAPPDLSSFDLSLAEDHASFFFLVSNDSARLRKAAGLN